MTIRPDDFSNEWVASIAATLEDGRRSPARIGHIAAGHKCKPSFVEAAANHLDNLIFESAPAASRPPKGTTMTATKDDPRVKRVASLFETYGRTPATEALARQIAEGDESTAASTLAGAAGLADAANAAAAKDPSSWSHNDMAALAAFAGH